MPEELTADVKARIEIEGPRAARPRGHLLRLELLRRPGAASAVRPVGLLIQLLTYNSFKPVRIKRIECTTEIQPGRRTADIEAVELDSDTLAPGDTLKATVSSGRTRAAGSGCRWS